VALIVLVMALVVGGGLWFLHAYGRKVTTKPVESTTNPAWMKQGITYPPEAQATEKAGAQAPDRSAEILRQLAALQQQLAEQQAALEALKRRPSTVINQHPAQAAKATSTPVQHPPGAMLFINHDLKDPPPGPQVTEYTLAPGATKLACEIETAMNSDVEGYFTAKVTTNVYDTATGQHLLIPQGSTILGNDQSSHLLYGNERMDTISLKLTLPDGRTVDLGKAPVTDQQGVAGLTGRVDQHYRRLFGAVFIGGALKGGISAMNVALNSAAGAGQVATGIASVGNQATNRVLTPMLNTRPTIAVDAGQLCNVLLLQTLHLPAMWQGTSPTTTASTSTPPRREGKVCPTSPSITSTTSAHDSMAAWPSFCSVAPPWGCCSLVPSPW
jgi:type IV secretory pathway VirB10-like protein